MRMTVDTERCIGSGMCALTAGEVFDQHQEDGTAIVLRPDPPAEVQDSVREAAGLCPAAAIVLSPADDR
ncbi:ferredoxin [Plantactinospora sp. WMMB782]|uniref:ferredoxin n=1 Tax=Plantactinospora sp. WMMB782 TaxID=3404121 RepID=UPI003B957817